MSKKKKKIRESLKKQFCQKGERRIVILPENNLLDPETQAELQEKAPNITIKTEVPFFISPDKYNKKRFREEDGAVFTHKKSTSSGDLFVEDTPHKKRDSELQFKGIPSLATLRKEQPDLFLNPKTDKFSFAVTADTLIKRSGVRRHVTQLQVMGISAKEIFQKYGAKIHKDMKAHLAHRHGWGLGGSQTRENLDPGLAGSNYSTFLWIEAPLKELVLSDESIKVVNVSGTVIFHPKLPLLPMEISYKASWGNGREVTISIYPLEARAPTYSEHMAVKNFLFFIRTPEKAKSKQETKQNDEPSDYDNPGFSL